MSDIASTASTDEEEQNIDIEEVETVDEKRLRLAKAYLSDVREEADKDDEQVAKRLKIDVEEQKRRGRDIIADKTRWKDPIFYKGHKLPVTCVSAASSDSNVVFTGGKDCVVIKWDIATGKKITCPGVRNGAENNGHSDQVLAVCAIDANTVVSGGKDRILRLWDARDGFTPKCQAQFTTGSQHQAAITSICLNPDSQELYTGSWDKTVRIWNLQTHRYVDALFGHSDQVNDIDILTNCRPVTCGSDRTMRTWKVQNDTHLLFQGHHTASVDCCAVIDSELMASGSQDGSIALWSQSSKKPLARRADAHACGRNNDWITALRAVRSSDLLYSGAEGGLKAWKVTRVGKKEAKIDELKHFNARGYVNGICATKNMCIAAVAKEHKFGRWTPCKGAQNGLLIIPTTEEPEDM